MRHGLLRRRKLSVGRGQQIPSDLFITEIFHSIQGESTWAGYPCSFIRLAGCNLRCTWCDTQYSFTPGERWLLDDVLSEIARADLPTVEVTGGEPLLQEGVYALLDAMLAQGRRVLLETNGTISIVRVPEAVHKIVDMKPPGSGEADKNDYANLSLVGRRDEIKLVIIDRADYEWSRELVRKHELVGRVKAVTFAPVHGELKPTVLAEWMREDGLDARLGVQLHKLLWPRVDRGR